MNIKVLYFARLREKFGRAEESMPFSAGTVGALLELLRNRGPVWSEQLSADRNYRVAVNQVLADASTPIKAGDEIAIFPPVTGG